MAQVHISIYTGIGSRFGGGIKQLEPVGLHNEIIMDYSIHDAIEAGFNKIIFVIRIHSVSGTRNWVLVIDAFNKCLSRKVYER